MIRTVMPILLILFSCKVCGQNKNYTFSEIGWTINFPSNLNSKDTMNLFESGSNKSIEIYGGDATNLVRFSVIHFNTNPDFNRRVLNDATKNLMYLSHLPSSNKSKIDTASSNEKIAGIRFEKFHSILTLDKNNKSTILLYSQLYNGYILTIEAFFTDENKGKQFLKIIRSSKFKRMQRKQSRAGVPTISGKV